MASINWNAFRFNKMVKPGKEFEQYPAVISLFGRDSDDEAHLFAEFVAFLKEQRVVTDYNQIALLMYSVKTYKSDVYIKALEEKGIPVFCPRAGTYFEEEEICLMVGCFARIFGYSGGLLSDVVGHYQIHDYLKRCYAILALECESSTTLEATLQELETEILGLSQGQKLDKRIADLFFMRMGSNTMRTLKGHFQRDVSRY